MAKIMDTQPDKILHLRSSQWLFYFTGGRDYRKLPIGAEYLVVYSPVDVKGHWEATLFRVVPIKDSPATSLQVVAERELTAEEVAHFEGLIADRGGEG